MLCVCKFEVWKLLCVYVCSTRVYLSAGVCLQLAALIESWRDILLKPLLHTPKRYVIWKDFDIGVFCSLTSWNFVNWQLGIDEGIHLSHICLVEAKLSGEILSHGAPFVFCGDL